MRADALDLFAQAIVPRGRELGSRLMQRDHVRASAIAVSLDERDFGAAHGRVNLDARDAQLRIADGGGEVIERLEKMDIGIPERVVSVEDEIERFSRGRRHLHTEYRRVRRRAIGLYRGKEKSFYFNELCARVRNCGGENDQCAG